MQYRLNPKTWLAAASFALGLAGAAAAQDFPNRPIQIVASVPTGSANDILARQIADKLQTRIGTTVIVVNKPGAGTVTATDFVAKSPADGHTLLLGNSVLSFSPFLYAKLPYDPRSDFAGVALVAESPYIVAVNNDLGVKTMKELIALAKAKPKSINYASGGIGSATHMACELFAKRAGIALTHIPYTNTASIGTDLQSNVVQMMCSPPSSIVPLTKRGRVSIIGVSSVNAITEPVSTPSIKQTTGVDFVARQWFGLVAPRKTPQPVLQKIAAAMEGVLNDADFRARLKDGGLEVRPLLLGSFDDFLMSELELCGPIVTGAGIKID